MTPMAKVDAISCSGLILTTTQRSVGCLQRFPASVFSVSPDSAAASGSETDVANNVPHNTLGKMLFLILVVFL